MAAWANGTQLSLDGMADWPASPPPLPPPSPPPPPPVARPQRLPPTAAPSVSATPAEPTVAWAHPQANRQAMLSGQPVAYLFRRGQRKTIGFSVGAQGLSVSAPRWSTLSAVDAALQAKADWVLRALRKAGQHHQALQGQRLDWRDGTLLPWLGGHMLLRVGQPERVVLPGAEPDAPNTPASPRTGRRKPTLVQVHDNNVWVGLPPTATPAQLRDAVQAWMSQAAHAHFVQRLNHFAPLLGVSWTSLRLSSATTRWGSAKADGSIRLHWRLMHFEATVVDYVVAHELSHLRHMDHSPRFWQTVASVVPDYADWRAKLKGERLPPW